MTSADSVCVWCCTAVLAGLLSLIGVQCSVLSPSLGPLWAAFSNLDLLHAALLLICGAVGWFSMAALIRTLGRTWSEKAKAFEGSRAFRCEVAAFVRTHSLKSAMKHFGLSQSEVEAFCRSDVCATWDRLIAYLPWSAQACELRLLEEETCEMQSKQVKKATGASVAKKKRTGCKTQKDSALMKAEVRHDSSTDTDSTRDDSSTQDDASVHPDDQSTSPNATGVCSEQKSVEAKKHDVGTRCVSWKLDCRWRERHNG